jgi:hypothetical protein
MQKIYSWMLIDMYDLGPDPDVPDLSIDDVEGLSRCMTKIQIQI